MTLSRLLLFVHFVTDLALALYIYLLFERNAQRDEEFEDDYEFDDEIEDVALAQG
jgi:hypothetical protein